MRLALTSVLAAVLMTAGAASAQTPGLQPTITRAYTVEPFAPSAPITIQGQGVRLRAEPFTTRETPVLSSGSTGLQLTVVGLTRMPDWTWYQVVLKSGQKAFIRSDLTSAPMAGGGTQVAVAPPQVATQPVAQPRPTTSIDLPLPSSSSSAPLQSTPAPSANSGLISVAPAAPVPRLTPTGSLGDHVMAKLVEKRCWTDSSSMMDAQRLKAIFALTFGTDSKLAAEPVLIQPALSPTDDPAMMVFIAKVRAALRTCNGMGFDIPADYFKNGARPEVRVEFKAR